MTKHPLTDDLAERIAIDAPWCDERKETVFTHDDMRSSANWQLKEFKAAVAETIADLRKYSDEMSDTYAGIRMLTEADTVEFYFESILKILRPHRRTTDN